ncbi:MAG: DUF4349 domain-containing protein [Anaerolineaceae bacterium]|nr:DUF4349 domain-containing protein [Anaerolineaceae bacterium]
MKRISFSTWVLLVVVVCLAVVIVLAMLGPSVGNIYSNITSSLVTDSSGRYTSPDTETYRTASAIQVLNTSSSQPEPAQPRIILRNATLRLVVADAQTTLDHIITVTNEMGGWVVTSSTNLTQTVAGQDVTRGSVTVRVPVEQLETALAQIKAEALTVESETITGQDVTQDYVDVSSRLTNLEAAESQLRELMEAATESSGVLEIFNQLTVTRGEIERLRGQIQYYDESAAFSSITVELIPQAVDAPVQIAGWNPGGTAGRALAALLDLLRFLADTAITVAIIGVPLVLIFGLPSWFIYRRVKRRKAG